MAYQFAKYHGLGNDYIIVDAPALTPQQIQRICHPHYGIGGDGVLLVTPSSLADFGVKIYNPDGSEAEKSGNGLRILARHLFDNPLVGHTPFIIETLGGIVTATVQAPHQITVEMGTVTIKELGVSVSAYSKQNDAYVVDLGNPHCVVTPLQGISAELVQTIGPLLQGMPVFPNGTNVQLLKKISQTAIQIEIWERGAGYTLASGSSACAAAAVAVYLGWCNTDLTVVMPGGELQVALECVDEANDPNTFAFVKQTGPVVKIAQGVFSAEIFN